MDVQAVAPLLEQALGQTPAARSLLCLIDGYLHRLAYLVVRELTGKSTPMAVDSACPVRALANVLGYPADQCRFIANGKALPMSAAIGQHIQGGASAQQPAVLHLVLRLGCAPMLDHILGAVLVSFGTDLAGPGSLLTNPGAHVLFRPSVGSRSAPSMPVSLIKSECAVCGSHLAVAPQRRLTVAAPAVLVFELSELHASRGSDLEWSAMDEQVRRRLSSHVIVRGPPGGQPLSHPVYQWVTPARLAFVLSDVGEYSVHVGDMGDLVGQVTHLGAAIEERFVIV